MVYPLLRDLLFKLNPETSHHLALESLQLLYKTGALRLLRHKLPTAPRMLMELYFANPVGLAAGLDKNGDYIDALGALGFGFIEIGTITPRAQPGNPKPRLFRIPEAQALINRMGFNNKGVDYLVNRLQRSRYKGVLGINIGKNLNTPIENADQDYVLCLQKVYEYAHYITINISSPNTQGLRNLQSDELLDKLLSKLKTEQNHLTQKFRRYVPMFIKIAPDVTSEEIKKMAEHFLHHQIDAVIATNTTVSREGVEQSDYAQEAGGLSGAPLFKKSHEVVKNLSQSLQNKIPIVACGGIMSAQDAVSMFNAGASLVQIYTGFVYKGFNLINEIVGYSILDS